MAKQVIIKQVDDIDGSAADRTVKFSFDGVTYEIDVSEENFAKMRKAVEPFIRAGRRVGGRQQPKKAAKKQSKAADMRRWAQENGMAVPDRGRIPNAVQEAYEKAHAA